MKPVQTDFLPTTFSAEKLRSERVAPMAGMPTNILDEGGLRLARCDFDGVFNADAESNARRFIACWNAMIGIPDPQAFREKCEALQKFKDWVHAYLDGKGIPHHPPGVHGAEGCRIGDRMDYVFSSRLPGRGAVSGEVREAAERILREVDGRKAIRCSCGICYWCRSGRSQYLKDTEFLARHILAAGLESVEGWRPIETAPKDGTKVLLLCVSKAMSFGGTHAIQGYWGGNTGFEDWSTLSSYKLRATHWQPLPSNPNN